MLKKEEEQLSKKGNYTAAIAVAYRDHVVEHAPRPNQASVHTSTCTTIHAQFLGILNQQHAAARYSQAGHGNSLKNARGK